MFSRPHTRTNRGWYYPATIEHSYLLLLRTAVVSWLELRTQVCQSKGSGFKSRSGQIAYFNDQCKNPAVNIRDWWCSSWFGLHVKQYGLSRTKFGGHKRTTGEAGIVTTSVFREIDWDYSGNWGLSISHWLPCPQAVRGAIRGGFIPKLLSYLEVYGWNWH